MTVASLCAKSSGIDAITLYDSLSYFFEDVLCPPQRCAG